MDYEDVYTYTTTPGIFQKRAAVAIAVAAVAVLAEDPGTADHQARVVWAKATLANTIAMASAMAFAIMANTTLQASGDAMLDSDLQFQVNSLVTTYSTLTA